MKKRYRKRRGNTRGKAYTLCPTGKVKVELPLPVAEILAGVEVAVEELATEAGLALMQAAMEAEAGLLAGPRYARIKRKEAYRWGGQNGVVIYGGRKFDLDYPRVRSLKGVELPLATYRQFKEGERIERSVYQKLLLGISTRKYERAIEDFCQGYGVSKSSVGRHFIKATAKQLRALLERRLDTLDLIAILIDGIEFKGYLLVVALGVDEEGRKHVLGLWQGATENTEVVTALLEDLVERGLSPSKNYLFVLDGAKALRKAVKKVFGEEGEVQRCQLHKRRNVKSYLPLEHQEIVDRRLRAAYSMADYHEAKHSLGLTIRYLKRLNPSAARSLEEGLEETLTLHRLGVPFLLRKSLSSTNLIESPFSTSKDLSRRVKRWRNGEQVQRWAAASLLEAERRFRRINGYRYLPVLDAVLNQGEVEKERSIA